MPLNKIPTRQLGEKGPIVSTIGLGTMTIAGTFYGDADPAEISRVLTHAADRGLTFWDCADVYGDAEIVLGKWFEATGRRDEIFLCTKFGGGQPDIGVWLPTSKPSYIRKAVQRSLTRLKTPYIDLYWQHRVDPETPVEVVIQTLGEFIDQGKIKYIGLSECSVSILKRAKSVPVYGEKVVAVQMEFSPFTLDIEKDGFANAARELGVGIVAYSPLGRGLMSGRFKSRSDFGPDDFRLTIPRFSEENFPKNLELVDKINKIAAKYTGTTACGVTLAWILAEHPDFIPLPSGRTVERVEDNAKASELKLDAEDIKTIRQFAEAVDAGLRYAPAVLAVCEADCIPLDQWKGE